MFTLKKPVARNLSAHPDDMANIKFALTSLGYYDDTETGLSPYGDDQLFHAVKSFQKDNDLKADGIIKPDGPTQEKINDRLKKDKNSGNIFQDFWKNYKDMREADFIGADKYFHCKANYEASQRSWVAAKIISDEKETLWSPKEVIENGLRAAIKDSAEDQEANRDGRTAARSGRYISARDACEIYRPEGLDEKY